ncbi:MAG: ribulokinase [Armatimonadetes bacterium]|nr:ribulokinase [Armatimonadota bacterium]
MSDRKLALGIDFGTNSVRALVVDCATGEELATAVADYEGGEAGVFLDPKDPNLARQNPRDYSQGFYHCVGDVLHQGDFSYEEIVGIGVDTTGSTPIPISESGVPLALDPLFAGNRDAMAWLWKDHTSYAEAQEITELAKNRGEPYLAKCGGTYSSEWFWSKILHCARTAPDVYAAASSWCECQDMVPAWLTGASDAASIKRGVCAAGHKAMFSDDWGGLPSEDFLNALHPGLGDLRKGLYDTTQVIGEPAGGLDTEIAEKSGLRTGTPVSVGAMDAHLGAVGSGVKPGRLVKIMGTSTCDIMVGDASTPDIQGVCGIVPGSVIPGLIGIEAGQSAVGDLFEWCATRLPQALLGGKEATLDAHSLLNGQASALRPGESGLLALDWNNGNRTVLVDPLLSGLLVGQSLHTTLGEVYRALIEATAFGARRIIEQIETAGVPIEEIVVCGGIAEKSALTMQIYADVCNRPIMLSRSAQTCALGAAIAGSVVGGAHRSVPEAIEAMTGVKDTLYRPTPNAVETYDRLYGLYLDLHDAFGTSGTHRPLGDLMKELIRIRSEARK